MQGCVINSVLILCYDQVWLNAYKQSSSAWWVFVDVFRAISMDTKASFLPTSCKLFLSRKRTAWPRAVETHRCVFTACTTVSHCTSPPFCSVHHSVINSISFSSCLLFCMSSYVCFISLCLFLFLHGFQKHRRGVHFKQWP